jgi:hypothetical protein
MLKVEIVSYTGEHNKVWVNQCANIIPSAAYLGTIHAYVFQESFSVAERLITQSITLLILQYFYIIITNVVYTIFASVHTNILEYLWPRENPSVVILLLDPAEVIRFYSYKANLIYKTRFPSPIPQLISWSCSEIQYVSSYAAVVLLSTVRN